MNCQEVRELLSLYIDNMLEENEQKQIQKHLQECSQCQQELEELKMTMELIKGMEEITPPPSFRKEIISRLHIDDEAQTNSENQINTGNQDAEVIQVFDMKAYKEKFKKITTHNMFLGTAIAACIMIVVFSFKYVQFGHNPVGLHSYGGPESNQLTNRLSDRGGTNSEVMLGAGNASANSSPEAKAEYSDSTLNEAIVSEGNRDSIVSDSKMKRADSTASKIQRKVMKNAVINMETKNFNKTINALDGVIENQQGYYEKKEINTQGDKFGSFIIKVPAKTMTNVMKEFEKIGNVVNTSISSTDVTTQYYDTETRIGVLQKQESRLLEILKNAKNVEEILKVENQLARVREQIETDQGHLKILNDSIEMSTLTLEIRQVQEITKVQQPTGIKGTFILAQDAFKYSIKMLLGITKATVIFLVGAIPFIVILALLGGGYFYYRKKRNKEE